jgi:hypothetical protein
MTGRGEYRSYVGETADVVGPAVQENDCGTISRTRFGISDTERAGIDLLE